MRFRIAYRDPESLIREIARDIGRNEVVLESWGSATVGTKFLFELLCDGASKPVELEGDVTAVVEMPDGRNRLSLRYLPRARGDLDALVQQVLRKQQDERVRAQPRVPVHLAAAEAVSGTPEYVIRDLSVSGMGVEVIDARLPDYVRAEAAVGCIIPTTRGPLSVPGAIAWWFAPSGAAAAVLNPAFGVRFTREPGFEDLERLDRLLTLKEFPRGKARLDIAR